MKLNERKAMAKGMSVNPLCASQREERSMGSLRRLQHDSGVFVSVTGRLSLPINMGKCNCRRWGNVIDVGHILPSGERQPLFDYCRENRITVYCMRCGCDITYEANMNCERREEMAEERKGVRTVLNTSKGDLQETGEQLYEITAAFMATFEPGSDKATQIAEWAQKRNLDAVLKTPVQTPGIRGLVTAVEMRLLGDPHIREFEAKFKPDNVIRMKVIFE